MSFLRKREKNSYMTFPVFCNNSFFFYFSYQVLVI